MYRSTVIRGWQAVIGVCALAACVCALNAASLAAQPLVPATIPALTPTPVPDSLDTPRTPQAARTRTLPTRTPTRAASPTPPPTAVSVCDDAPPTRLIVGERGRVLRDDPRPLRVRAAAGTETTIIDQIPVSSLFYVLEGPVCAGEFAWYQIVYRDDADTTTGWIAEGEQAVYYVEPYPPGW